MVIAFFSIYVVGPVCLWLALGMPFWYLCRRAARQDSMSQFEAGILGLLTGPVGLWLVRHANDKAALKAAEHAAEVDIKLIQAAEERAAEEAEIAKGGAPAFQPPPPPMVGPMPLPPEDLPGSQAFRPPPPEVQGSWLTDPPSDASSSPPQTADNPRPEG